MSYDLLRIFLCSSDLCLQASKEPSAAHPPHLHPLRLSSRAVPVLLDEERTCDAEPEPGVMCVLRGRGARERPWSNTGWVVVLSIHVLTDPIGSPCADPVLSLESSMRNGPVTFRNIPRKLPQDSDMRNVPGTFLES